MRAAVTFAQSPAVSVAAPPAAFTGVSLVQPVQSAAAPAAVISTSGAMGPAVATTVTPVAATTATPVVAATAVPIKQALAQSVQDAASKAASKVASAAAPVVSQVAQVSSEVILPPLSLQANAAATNRSDCISADHSSERQVKNRYRMARSARQTICRATGIVLHGQILASQVQNVWRVDVIMQIDALKQKAKPSEVVVTPVQTPQPVSGATPVILTPPPVSLGTSTPSLCVPRI